MKKLRLLMSTFLLMFVLVLAGCSSQGAGTGDTSDSAAEEIYDGDTTDPEEIEAAFEDELTPLEGDELAMLEDFSEDYSSDEDEMTPLDESELEADETENTADASADDQILDANSEDEKSEDGISDAGTSGTILVEEDGTYTSKDEVAVYIHTYGHLPSNYITKKEAQELGWVSSEGNLDEVAPGKSIGGDKYGNYDKMLPEEDGRTYQECDIDFDGGFRNEKRIIYSSDGLIFYTEDHYETFQQLY